MGEPTMEQMAESSYQDEQYRFVRITDSLLQLYAPDRSNEVEVDIIFFHGLQLGSGSKNHLSTWRRGDGAQELWPQVWLPEDYPKARITVVSYDASINTTSTDGRMDLYLIREALFQESRISYREQGGHRPVILVGHSFGGLVIKELCLQAHRKKESNDVDSFIERIRGIFFYSTPHSGMDDAVFRELVEGSKSANEPLLSFIKTLSTNAARLHHEFCSIQKEYSWKIYGLGETNAVEGTSGVLVREASCRFGDEFIAVAGCHHFSVCRPTSKECNSYQHLVELIGTVCDKQKKKRRRCVKMDTVGIDSLVTDIIQYVPKKVYLGFFGMGGVGKTTVAKRVFEEIADQFEYTCLVEDFKLITGDREEVKTKVWSKMHHHGRPIITMKGSSFGAAPFGAGWSELVGKKLLMLLDDVATEGHIHFLESIATDNDMEQSRFIVTSRDERLLRLFDQCGQTHLREIPFLSDEDAMQLFCKYVLLKDEEPAEWMKGIMEEIVKGCGGLPLTLEVLGKYLRTIRRESIWKELPGALRKAEALPPLERVWAKLRISYDALQTEEKNVFLDLACAYIRDFLFTDETADYILSSRCTSLSNILQSLMDKCFVKRVMEKPFEQHFHFQMHEHLRSMGEKMAKEEGKLYLTHHQSSTSVEEIQNILSDRSFCEKIVSFKFSYADRPVSSRAACIGGHLCLLSTIRRALPQMSSLLYLDLDLLSVECIGTCLPSGLPLPANVVLVSLMSRTRTRPWNTTEELWKRRNATGKFSHLQKLSPLRLAYSIRSRCTESPVGLQRGPCTVGQLQQLRVLRLWLLECEELPDAIGDLKQLLHLGIGYCSNLRQLPKNFGDLGKLEYLALHMLESLQHLPVSIGNLTNLKELVVRHVGLMDLPETFGNLTKLRHLSLLHCHCLRELPVTFGDLGQLSWLSLICGNLERVPGTFGNLVSLQYLTMDLPSDAISELPETFADLSNLEHLEITCLQRFPPLIGKLSNLKTLTLGHCYRSVLSVTSDKLIRLEEVRLTETYISYLEEVQKIFCNASGSSHCTVKLYRGTR